MAPLLVNLKPYSNLPAHQPAKRKEKRTPSPARPLQGTVTGPTPVLCCLGRCLGVSLSLHLICTFHFCLILAFSSLWHYFLVPSLWFFFKLFQAFLVYFIFASTLCECYQSTWQWVPGQLAFSWKWTTWYCCDQYPSLSSGFYFILLAELGTWLVFPPSELLYMTLWSTYWISARLRFPVAGWRIRISGYHCINSS